MSLPRYLAIKRLAFEQTATWGDYAVEALGAGVYFGKRVYEVLDAAVVSGKTTKPLHVACCFMLARWAINELRCHKRRELDGMDGIEARLNIELPERGSHFEVEWGRFSTRQRGEPFPFVSSGCKLIHLSD
jgi:hypothetical protein